MTGAIEQLGSFAAALDVRDVGTGLVAKLKDHILDTIGVACAGLSDPQARALAQLQLRWGGAAQAEVIGLCLRLPAPKAAFLNALLTRVHTFDDTYEAGPAHPGSAVVSAALAAGERTGATGYDLLAAVLAGYEVAVRVCAALGSSHYDAGFHSTGTVAPFGAAAAAARALRLDGTRSAHALALAGEAAAGSRQYQIDGSLFDTALNGARGAELGVAAAEMAAIGITGPLGVLDGRWGMLRVMAGGDASGLTRGLGSDWMFPATVLKPYASCRFTHGQVGALRAAAIDPAQLEGITIRTFRTSIEVSDRPDPANRMEAVLSHQIAAALALLRRPMLPSDYDALDEDVLALARRVRVVYDPALDARYPERWPDRIAVQLRGGRALTLESDAPPCADHQQARAKFCGLAGAVLGRDAARDLETAVDQLESLPDLSELVRLMRPSNAKAA